MKIASRLLDSLVSLAVLAVCLLATPPAAAVWSANPAVNLAVADGAGTQTLPLVASTSDGGLWVAWFDGASGNFNVYLQRLNAAGAEQFPHNGLLISNHAQNTALFGWDMIADSDDNAVLVFSDIRDGGDLDVFAYKIDPAGAFLWGANGVQISANPDFDPAPRVIEASDGEIVIVWQRDPPMAMVDGDVRMQRLTPAGVPLLAPGGLAVVAEAGKDPGFVGIAAADGGNVILSWLRDIRTFASSRHVRARKFSAAGAALWGAPVEVYNAFSVPIGYAPKIESDGAGGAILLWHRSDGTFFNSFVQRVDSAGSEVFPHNGVEVSTTPNMHHIDPTMSLDSTTGDVLVFWNERNSAQSQWGIFGQKISPAGARQWGAGGVTLLPVNTVNKSFPRSVQHGDGAMVFLVDGPIGTDRLFGMRVNPAGAIDWTTTLSSVVASKTRYPVTIDATGVAKVVWEDGRNPSIDIYAQNVNPDGTLGVSPAPGRIGGLAVARSILVPGDLTLSWTPSCAPGAVNYAIYEGVLGNYTSHVKKDCSDSGGDLTEEITPALGDRYYLVVPLGIGLEGSYGTNSSDAERPVPPLATDRCETAQMTSGCP